MIPGDNILLEALELISSQTVKHFKATTRVQNAAGFWVSSFAAGVDIPVGSVQAVPRNRFQVLGLEYEKYYVTWFVPANIVSMERDTSGDQFEWNGDRFDVLTVTDWYGQDGWLEAVGVRIGKAGNA